MASHSPNPPERVTISDALEFLRQRTGYDFNPRTFQRWCEGGCVQIDERQQTITCQKIGGLWYISRLSLDELVAFLSPGAQTS